MARYVGMYRRSELARIAKITSQDSGILRATAIRAAELRCAAGSHRQETDAQTGDEVCQFCGVVIDDYADVAKPPKE